ncbi:hypothetical protein ACFRJ8_21045 [Arthrobacter sp. NPDC056886]|uniref:hypothetical protein n=1 Tax=Arthrobacter sp. NPDC056886 TaxID=3345960 RepID=UPI003672B4FA
MDGRDHKGVGDWLFPRPLQWRLGVQVVAIDPSAAFRKALRMWLSRTAVAVDHFTPGLPGQPGRDRGPAEPVPAGQGRLRPRDPQGLGPPDAPARRRHTHRERGMPPGRDVRCR